MATKIVIQLFIYKTLCTMLIRKENKGDDDANLKQNEKYIIRI
jgi:hypothetical protein